MLSAPKVSDVVVHRGAGLAADSLGEKPRLDSTRELCVLCCSFACIPRQHCAGPRRHPDDLGSLLHPEVVCPLLLPWTEPSQLSSHSTSPVEVGQ